MIYDFGAGLLSGEGSARGDGWRRQRQGVCAGWLGEGEGPEGADGMGEPPYEGMCAGLERFKNAAASEKLQRTGAIQDAVAGMRG